jgi:hypothetical protein
MVYCPHSLLANAHLVQDINDADPVTVDIAYPHWTQEYHWSKFDESQPLSLSLSLSAQFGERFEGGCNVVIIWY